MTSRDKYDDSPREHRHRYERGEYGRFSYHDERSSRRRRSRSPLQDNKELLNDRRDRRDSNDKHRYRSRSRERKDYAPGQERTTVSRKSTRDPTNNQLASREEMPIEKQRPNFGVSGKLAAETNAVKGTEIVLKYNEPPEARKPSPSQAWRLYVFKDKENVDDIQLCQRSCWLFGRERVVADYHLEHPSVSKQHAVIQFRHAEKRNEFGDRIGIVKPYLIDLDSANGTAVNEKEIPASRYYELRSGDVISFADSSREYVMVLPPKE